MRTLAEWLQLHESAHPRSIDLGLARVARVAHTLGLDRPGYAVITVAGTNGKGSVAAHLDSLLRSLGGRSGLFTSPHFLRYHERIRVDGREVSDGELIGAFEHIEAARGETTLTFFEYNTLAALMIFAQRAIDVAVLEVGLGGRLDATNLVDADVAVLASVGFDHRDWLGETLEQIGAEKAGIFRAGKPAVLGTPHMPASVFGALRALGARAVIAERDFRWQLHGDGGWDYHGLALTLRGLPPSSLAGFIQFRNAATALAALEALRAPDGAPAAVAAAVGRLGALSERSVTAALEHVRLAGRFQIVPGAVEWILDIAHNEPAALILAAELRERRLPRAAGTQEARRTFAVIGVLADKDAAAIAAALQPVIDRWIVCALPGPRGTSAEQLAQRLALPADSYELAASVIAGCERARALTHPGERVVVCGSVQTVGPALEWLGLY